MLFMWDNNDILAVAAAYVIISGKKKNKKRKCWVRPTLQGRNQYGGSQLMASLIKDDQFTTGGHFFNFIRMSVDNFEELHSRFEPMIKKRDTSFRYAIPSRERLLVTLRFLATGDSYQSLMLLFKISKQAISLIIPEVCNAINETLKNLVKVSILEHKINHNTLTLVYFTIIYYFIT